MSMLISLAVFAVIFFIWKGLETRCPDCGRIAIHPKGDQFDAALNPGFAGARFKCRSCGHQFTRRVAIEWLTISNKIGEEQAIHEYRKMQ